MSESKIKDEALVFFHVSPEERLKDKKVFKIRLEDLLKVKIKHRRISHAGWAEGKGRQGEPF